MDDKVGRRKQPEDYRRRQHKQAKQYGRKIWKFLSTHKSAFFTGTLLFLLVALLFGIFSQFQPPIVNTSTPPSGVTTIDYSTFVSQVKAGNVLAVTIQGNTLNALLEHPFTQTTPVTLTTTAKDVSSSSDYMKWSRYIGTGNATISNVTGTPPVDPNRAVFTQLPQSGDTSLMNLLTTNHVIVNTAPVSSSSGWLTLLWRLTPLILVSVLMLIFFAARNSTRSTRSIDDRVTQMGKNRARRFERTRETSTGATNKPASSKRYEPVQKPSNVNRSGQPANVVPAHPVPQTTFADVAGIDEVRVELEEIVQFLRDSERFTRLGAHIPRGALLVGPPGTGKTLLARAVAGEASVPFFSMSASEFVEMFVGVGASRVRDLFHQARQSAPCVIFIDELDAVGRKRSMRVSGNDERDQTLNQLLVELDGFDARQAVVVLAATNRVDILDKALLRPGRFDRHVTVSPPDRIGREAILRVHTRKTPLHEDVSLERLSRMTTGMTGADLANLINEAALSAARLNLEHVTHSCFEDALARVQLGALRPLVMSERERRIIAIHEGGHALVAYHLPEADCVNRVTILPRGQSLGVTQFTAEEDRYNYSRETLMARIAVGLGGRVAEELTFGPQRITTGAENDLQVVTDLARRMVTRWGMSEQVGVIFADYQPANEYALNLRRLAPDALPMQTRTFVADADGRLQLNGNLPEQPSIYAMSMPAPQSNNGVMMNALIDTEIQRILNEGRAMARQILTEHNDQLTLLADTLIEHEQLDRNQFEALLR